MDLTSHPAPSPSFGPDSSGLSPVGQAAPRRLESEVRAITAAAHPDPSPARIPTRPIPSPEDFRHDHGPLTRWSSGTYDEYDTVLLVAVRNNGVSWIHDDNKPERPRTSKPGPGGDKATAIQAADKDLIWPHASHTACPNCGQPILSSGHVCKTVAAVGLIHHGRTHITRTPHGTTGRITPAAVTEARRALHTTRQQLARTTLRGIRRWKVVLRADSAHAALTAGGAL